jgi:SAM-dependent methyltransferase
MPNSGAISCSTRNKATLSLPPDTAAIQVFPAGPAHHAFTRRRTCSSHVGNLNRSHGPSLLIALLVGPVLRPEWTRSIVVFPPTKGEESRGQGLKTRQILSYDRAMKEDLIALFVCPRCRGSFRIDGEPATALACTVCGAAYPVVRGIPRLAGETYAASFGRQWNRHDVARRQEDEATFQVKTGVSPAALAGLLVLDAGCGGGRYSLVAGSHGARVVGVDLSSAVEKAASLCEDLADVCIVQANLLDLPVVDGAFDLVFSIGVLHHTPDPRKAFVQIARKVKPGGRLAVWLYRKNTIPQEWINSGLRAVTTRLPVRVLEPLCAGLGLLGGIPVLNQTLNKVANFSGHPDWTLRVCDNFDWYAPRYQSHHTPKELKRWFAEEGFAEIAELPPARTGRVYDWAYEHNMIIGSGVNVAGIRGR